MTEFGWTVPLEQPGQTPRILARLVDPLSREQTTVAEGDGYSASVRVTQAKTAGGLAYSLVEAQIASTGAPLEGYLSLCGAFDGGETFVFHGPATERELYRQSPHDPADHKVDMARQAVPMVAVRDEDGWVVALSDNPVAYDNYITQSVDPGAGTFAISSGDSGEMPGYVGKHFDPHYHMISTSPHIFRLLIFASTAGDLPALRRDLFEVIDGAWGDGTTRFHALCFATNYMHLRRNETGFSDYWIVPGIEYANKQYTRDAFWQSTVLPLAMQQQIYDAVYEERYKYAENGMLFLIWSYRIQKSGGQADLERARDALGYVEGNTRDGWYHADRYHATPHMRSWYDNCSFEDDDTVTYNQSLLPLAMRAARDLGLEPVTTVEQALANYRSLYLPDGGFFPLSQQKRILCVDALVGDTLSQIVFREPLLADEPVRHHYRTIMARAKTPYGFKVTCAEDGSFLPPEAYGADGWFAPFFRTRSAGTYTYGGSWFLYDMLCLMSCYLHGADGAEDEIIERMALEIRLGGTYHEYINTVTGEPGKPTYGWNAAIYPFWAALMGRGLASARFFDEIEALLRG